MPAFSLDVQQLESEVGAEYAKMVRNPPDRSEIANAADAVSDDDAYLGYIIKPMIRIISARSVLRGVQRQVQKVGCKSCLQHLCPVNELGHGADGEVWLLKSGHAAKLGIVNVDDDRAFEDHIASISHEVNAARAAGKAGLSPKVYEAWLCTSSTRLAYVIVMDAVKNACTLGDWKKKASPISRSKLLDKLEGMTTKLNALGIFHEDLHSSNVLVDSTDRPWIIDYSRCTYVETLKEHKLLRGDIERVRRHLAEAYIPGDLDLLSRCISLRLQERGVIHKTSLPEETEASWTKQSDQHKAGRKKRLKHDSPKNKSAWSSDASDDES